jgi:outer membrane protein TolC
MHRTEPATPRPGAQRSRSQNLSSQALGFVSASLLAVLPACSFTPVGTDQEHAKLDAAGRPYEPPVDHRVLPDLPPQPTWRDVLSRAFLASGDVEAAYFEWKAALERVGIASAWPNSRLTLGYSVALGPSDMKTFDRMTFAAGVDPMQNLSWPTKTAADGRVALDRAREAGERFRAAKFALQQRVLSAWARYGGLAERITIEREDLELRRLALSTSRSRMDVGGPQADLLRADVAVRTAEESLHGDEAELQSIRAELNALLAREPSEPLAPPPLEPRPVPADDAALLAAMSDQNPELVTLGHRVAERGDALERARLEWVPDINPSLSITGTIAQAIGAAVVLPTTVAQIEGGVREAGAMLRASEATLRQSRRDKAAVVVATLVMLRHADRQATVFEHRILPTATLLASTMRQRYAAGSATYADLLDAERAVLSTRTVIAEARAMREQRLAELEALIGADIEAIAPNQPESSPTEPAHDQ